MAPSLLPTTLSEHRLQSRIASLEMAQRGQCVGASRADPAIPRDAKVMVLECFGIVDTANNLSQFFQFHL